MVNAELESIDWWLCANKLSLNVHKSSYMIFTNKLIPSIPTVIITNISLSFVTRVKFLGVEIDQKLPFYHYITNVWVKLNKSLTVIEYYLFFLSLDIIHQLYITLLYPHLIYCVEVWGRASKTSISRRTTILGRCVKVICGGVADIGSFVRKYSDFEYIYRYFTLIRIYKYLQNDMTPYFSTKYASLKVNRSILTRFHLSDNLNFPEIHLTKYQQSFFIYSISLWNSLPFNVKSINFLSKYKETLQDHI